jgi:hypothetical protein
MAIIPSPKTPFLGIGSNPGIGVWGTKNRVKIGALNMGIGAICRKYLKNWEVNPV